MIAAIADRRLALARTRFWWVSLTTALAAWAMVAVRMTDSARPTGVLPWPIIVVAVLLTLRALYALRLRRRALRPIADDAIPAQHPKTNP